MLLSSQSILFFVFSYLRFDLDHLEYWMKKIRFTCKESVVILVGTHDGSVSDESIEDSNCSVLTRFPKYQYPMLSQIIPINTKTGRGIRELKETLTEEGERMNFDCNSVPPAWVNFSNVLQGFSSLGKPTMDHAEVCIWASQCNLSSESLPDVLHWLHISGIIFPVSKNRQNMFIVLRPTWIGEIAKYFTSIDPQSTDNGIISRETVTTLLSHCPSEYIGRIIDLFLAHEIMFKVKGAEDDKFLIPAAVSSTRPTARIIKHFPSEILANRGIYGRVLRFSLLPQDLLYRFLLLAFQGHNIEVLYWQGGIMIEFQDIVSLIEQNQENSEIVLHLSFPVSQAASASEIWWNLLDGVKNITQVFHPALLYSMEEMIPCSHCQRRKKYWQRGFMFTMKECQFALLRHINYVYCQHIESDTRRVNIAKLVPELNVSRLPRIRTDECVLGESIGEGSYGKIMKGKYHKEPVAVKQLKCDLDNIDALLPTEVQEFLFEAQMMNQLNHPNIVKFIGFTLEPVQIVFEFLSGGDLFQFLHPKNPLGGYTNILSEKFPWSQRLIIAFSLAKGLHYLQSLSPPVIHRDLRSPNIFVSN